MTTGMPDTFSELFHHNTTRERLLSHLLLNEELAVALIDLKGKLTYFNAGAEMLTDLPSGEVIGKSVATFFPNVKNIENGLNQALKASFFIAPDIDIQTAGGALITITVTIITLFDDEQKPFGFATLAHVASPSESTEQAPDVESTFFEDLLFGLHDAVIAVDKNNRITFSNSAVHNLFGLDPDDLKDREWKTVFPGLLIDEQPLDELGDFLAHHQLFEGKSPFPCNDGQSFTGLFTASALYAKDGTYDGWVASIHDVTEQDEILETDQITTQFLSVSSDVGRYLAEGLPLHSLLERLAGSILLQLDLKACFFYLIDSDHKNATLEVFRNIPDDFRTAVRKLNLEFQFVQKIIENRQPTLMTSVLGPELKLTQLISKYGFEQLIIMPLFQKETLVGFLSLVPTSQFNELELSLTQSMGAQIALAVGNALLVRQHRETERKYSTVVERANDGIIISQDGVFKLANKQFADMLGYTVSEMLGMNIIDTMDPWESEAIYRRYQARISGRVRKDIYQGRLKTKSGQLIQVEFNAGLIQYDGRPASLSFVRDISKRIALQNTVVDQKDMAEFYNDVLTHDINNFCQTMLGHLDNTMSELPPDLDPIHMSRLSSSKNTIKKISHIIDRIRELMHIQTIDPETLYPVNLFEILDESIEDAHETFPTLDIRISSDVPKGAFILGNSLVILIFLNLLTNAIKHNENEAIRVEIKTASVEHDRKPAWQIDITDNGPGIPTEFRMKIFQRFQRFSKKEGKGLGMSIVHALVDKLSGELSIPDDAPSTLGGVTFRVVLPKA